VKTFSCKSVTLYFIIKCHSFLQSYHHHMHIRVFQPNLNLSISKTHVLQMFSKCDLLRFAPLYIHQSIYFLLTTIRLNIIRTKQKLSPVSIFVAGRICVVLCGARINSTNSDKYNMKNFFSSMIALNGIC
jgi:hypothetical protein